MKKSLLFCLFLSLNIHIAIAKSVLPIQQWKTSNGIPVYFVHTDNLPMLDVRLSFKAGSVYDGKTPGLANLTNSMIGEATSKMNTDQIANAFDSVGTIFSLDLNRNVSTILLRTLTKPEVLSKSITQLNTLLTDPKFPEKNVERIKKQTILGLKSQQQQPMTIARDAFYKTLYQGTPYAHPVNGTSASIQAINPEMIRQFYQRYYVANNATMVLVGNINLEKAKAISNQLSLNLPKGKKAKAIKPINLPAQNQTKHIPFPSSQTTVIMGQIGITRHNPDYFPLYVGNYILGGGSFASRLFKTIRVKHGLVYSIYSSFNPLPDRGPFSISFQTQNKNTLKALNLTHEVLSEFIKEGMSKTELINAKKNITGSFSLRLTNNNAIADNVLMIVNNSLPITYLDTFRDKVNQVTLDDIHHAFEKIVHPEKLVTITVGQHG